MQDREILSIRTHDTGFVIVDSDIYIGEPGDDSEKCDTVISWRNDVLHIEEYPLTDAMVQVLKMYIDRKL
jgi:hypothetical protein